MAETPEELYARAAGALRMPPLEEWDTFPFEGELRPRQLAPPVEAEKPRRGAGGVDCDACGAPDERFVWTQERSGSEPYGDFDFNRDKSALFRDRPVNVFQIKASYWLGI